jgi:hypothetical protein
MADLDRILRGEAGTTVSLLESGIVYATASEAPAGA